MFANGGRGAGFWSYFSVTPALKVTLSQSDVERPDMPSAVFPQLREIVFGAAGERASIDLSASFADGSVASVRESTKVT